MWHCQRWTYFLLNPTFISLSFLYQILSAEFLSKFQNFFEVEINQVNLTPNCWVHWVRGPFNYYVRKEVGGWGQKIAIFDDLQYSKSSKKWVGGPKKVKNMMTYTANVYRQTTDKLMFKCLNFYSQINQKIGYSKMCY